MKHALVPVVSLTLLLVGIAPVHGEERQGSPPAGLNRLQDAFRSNSFVAYTPSKYSPLAGAAGKAKREAIHEDLQKLHLHFDVLVTYSCSAEQGVSDIVPCASEEGFRVVLGIWDVKSVREIEAAIAQARAYSNTVIGVIVGNETMLRGEKWENLEAAISLVRAALPGVPVSTSEPITSYGNADLREIVDFHSPTCHWLFQGGNRTNVQSAVAWLNERIHSLREMPAGDKLVLIKEHGLPSGPEPFSAKLQREYWALCAAQMPLSSNYASVFFEGFDLPWKSRTNPSEVGAAEAHWGAFDTNGVAKPVVAILPRREAPGADSSNSGKASNR
jgi:exo-beta-1,3-glucanase (GH17 family)